MAVSGTVLSSVHQSINAHSPAATTMTNGAKTMYSRRRKVPEPSRIASPMARMRWLPGSARSTRMAVKAAKRRAAPPAARATIKDSMKRLS